VEPFRSFTIRAISYGTIDELHPVFNSNVDMPWNTYEPLVKASFTGTGVKLIPTLAVSWTNNAQATEWTFKLRPNVKFHDGTPFTADAVKFTIAMGKAHTYRNSGTVYGPIASVEVVDPLTVKITTSFPLNVPVHLSGYWSPYQASPSMVSDALKAGWISQTDSAKDQAVKLVDKFKSTGALGPNGQSYGTGPYMIKPGTYDPIKGLTMIRFADYWGGWATRQVDTIIVDVISDQSLANRLVANGEADVIFQGIGVQFLPLMLSSPHVRVQEVLDNTANYLQFNTHKAPLDNVLVRRALSYAIDYAAVLNVGYQGHGAAQGVDFTGAIPKNLPYYDKTAAGFTFDLNKAKDLLKQAGYTNGKIEPPVKLLATYTTNNPEGGPQFEAIRPTWRELGVELDVRGMQSGPWVALAFKGSLSGAPLEAQDVSITKWAPAMFATFPNLNDRYGQFGGKLATFNWSYWLNNDYKKLIDEAWANEIPNPAKARDLYLQAQKLLFDQAPGVAINNPPLIGAINKNWAGFVLDPGRGKAQVEFYYLRWTGELPK
jgi:peptide/nickel transport system substrate-binding protein